MQIVAVMTVDASELDEGPLWNFMRSAQGVVDRVVLVFRGDVLKADQVHITNRLLETSALTVHTVFAPKCGVSRARNVGLAYISRQSWVDGSDIISFPDDDCAYPAGLGEFIRGWRTQLGNPDIAILPYGPSPQRVNRSRFPEEPTPIGAGNAARIVASAGIFVSWKALCALVGFNEALGVGTKLQAGEDLDFVLRALVQGMRVDYWPKPIVIHNYRVPPVARQAGNIAVLRSYAYRIDPSRRVLFRSMLRTLLMGWRIRSFTESLSAVRRGLAAGILPAPVGVSHKCDVGGLQITMADPRTVVDSVVADFPVSVATKAVRSIMAAHIGAINSRHDADFRSAFNQADFALVDGISVAAAARLSRGVRLQKWATTDLVPYLLESLKVALGRPVRLAIIGGEQGVADKAGAALAAKYGADVVYAGDGFQVNYAAACSSIMAADADCLLVGMGMPLEAKWVARWKSVGLPPITVTCGGLLRLLAGSERRAPYVMQRLQAEWIWRVMTDPRRTAPRYVQGVWAVFTLLRESVRK